MALFRKPTPARVVLTAAASRILDPSSPQSKSRAPDAEYLYSLYTKLGPVHSALRDKYFAASKITYYPGQIVDVDQDPEAVTDGPALEAFERLKGPQGDFAQFVAETVLHWDVTGEAYLVGQVKNGVEEWDVWSSVEYMKYRNPTSALVMDAATELDQSDYILRCWRAHPMLREDPDSPLRAVVAACEQYVLYQDMLTALGRSRLVAPLQIIPSEIDFPETDDSGNPTSFGKWLMEAQGAAVADTSNPNRLAPITVESPAAFKDGWLTIDLARDLPEWVPGMIDSVLRQMAIGLDVPVGIFDSAGSMNHWTAWLEDDSLRLNYVDPPVLDVLDSFTRGYLWPTLQAPISEGGAGMGRDEAQSFVFWRDYSDLTSRSVTSADALASWDAGIITAEAARRSIGFTEADAPEDDPEAPPEVEEIPVQDEGQEIPVILAAATPSLAGIDQKLYTQLSEAGQAALDRALERAGAKVRTAVVDKAKDRQLASIIADVDMTLIPQTVGRENMTRLQLTESELIPEGVFNRYATRARDLLEQGQADTHTTVEKLTATPTEPEPEEPTWLDKAIAFLVAGITALATRRLFTPTLDPDPAETGEVTDTDIPADMVFDAMTLAGGGVPGQVAQRGLATGSLGETLIERSGFQIVDRVWTVGAPRVPFEPHHNLNGLTFQNYTDPALTTPLSASWLGVSYMFPGDHRGCVCTAEPVIQAFRGESPASPTATNAPFELADQALVPIWNPDTQTFSRLEQRTIEYAGMEGVPGDIQAAIKRGVNSYPPEFRPSRVEVVDFIEEAGSLGVSGIADTFGIKVGKGSVKLSRITFEQGAERVEHVIRHEVGHWKQAVLDDQAQRQGRRLGADLKDRLDAVVDDLIPDLETAEAMGLDYPWLVRSAHKKQVPGAPGNWDKEWFAELSAHISEGRVLPQALVDLVEEYDTVS